MSGIVAFQNSSTTPLNSGATFTGDWMEAIDYDSIIVAVKTDQNGTYTVQFSPDGTNADSTLTRYYRTDQIEPPHRFTITRRYVRVTFTNTSASNQTYFRLQTLFNHSIELNSPLDSVISQDFDSISVRPTDYTTEVALGRRQAASTWNKFGYNDDIDIGTEVIAAFGGAFNQKLSAGETLNIVSGSGNDTNSSGSGARQLIVYGVDSNWEEITEIVNLSGVTPVTTTNSFLGVNRIAIYSAGSGEVNAGLITATASSSGNTMATMPIGGGVTQQLIFYVPASTQFLASWLYLDALKASGGGSPVVEIKGWVYSDVAGAKFEVFRDTIDSGVEARVQLQPPEPFVIGEKSILWFEATVTVNNVSVNGRFSGKLIRDVDYV